MYLKTEQASLSNHLAPGCDGVHLGPPPATTYMPAARRPLSLPRSRAHDLGLAPPRFRPTPASPRPGLVPPRPRPASARSASVSVRLGLGPPRRRAPPRAHLHVPRRLRRRRATATAVPPLHRTWREPPPRPRLGEGGQCPGKPLERLPLTPQRCTCACEANGSVHATASTERPQIKRGGLRLSRGAPMADLSTKVPPFATCRVY